MKRLAQRQFIWAPVRGFFILAFAVSSTFVGPKGLAQEEGAEVQGEAAAPAPDAESATPPPAEDSKSAEESKPTEKKSDKANSAAADKSSGESAASEAPAEPAKPMQPIKPWVLSVEPIFKGPTIKRFGTPSDLTGRDRQILENLDYKPAGTRMRLEQIKKLTAELRKAQLRSEAALNASLSMLRLYEEQGMVFEWMRVVGISDPKYPDLNQTLKNVRRQQAQRYQELVLNYPKNPNLKQWKFKLTIARLKLGDPSVRDEAIAMLKTLQGTEQHELAAVGLTLDVAANRLPSPFGTIEQVMQASTDQYEGAAFKLILAEQEIARNRLAAAIPLLQDVIATCKNIRKADKEQTPGVILQAAASLLINVGLRNTTAVNQEIFQTLVNNDLVEYARSYLEDFALNSYTKNLPLALKSYGDILSVGQVSEAAKNRIESRMLDLTIASGDPKMIAIAWERATSRGVQKVVNLDSQMFYSMGQVMAKFKAKPEKDLALRIVAMHDAFVRGFPAYAAREEFELRTIDILYQTKVFNDVGRRSEMAISKFRDRANKISAYQYNLKARSFMMGLGTEIKIESGQKLTGEPAFATGYITNSDKLRELLPKSEGEQHMYQAAFVQLMTGPKAAVLARYEDAFTRAPRHPLAASSASVLLEHLMLKKELVDVEKFIRLMVKLGVIPSKDPYRNLAKLLEQVSFEIGKQLYDAKQFEPAGNRFAAFHREFPGSPNSPAALERAGLAFSAVKKTDLAIMAFEMYLKLYPKSPQAKEIRWSAAEMARGSKAFLKAAEHYQLFAASYPLDSAIRQVHLKAAECFRDGNKIPEALSEYERHLKLQKLPNEQKATLKSIADLAQKANNGMVALSAYERLAKLVRDPDEVINNNFNLLTVNQKLGRDEQAKKAATAAMVIRPSSGEGFKLQAKARFAAARYEVTSLRTRQVMNQKDLKTAVQTLVKDYERVKANLLAPCEIPGVDWCSLGYFETSKLAGDLAKLLAVVEPQADQEEHVIAELKSLILFNRDKFKSESKSFALQAEDALSSSGSPDADSSERIKLYVQQIKQARDESPQGSSAGGGSGEGDF